MVSATEDSFETERERFFTLSPCRAAGMDDYLCKPIELADLDAKLARWLPRP